MGRRHPLSVRLQRALAPASLVAGALAAGYASGPAPVPLPPVAVVATTPLQGFATSLAQVPFHVQSFERYLLPPVAATEDDARPLRLGFAKGRWRINDRVYDAEATPIEVARDARETWLLRDYHASAPHAMHLPGYPLRVLERETSPDLLPGLGVDVRGRLPTDSGSKDTLLARPGESVRIAIDFALPWPEPQVYLVHCHSLEHEDAGMMLRVRVG